MSRRAKRAFVALAGVIAAGTARANDSSAEIALGGLALTKSDAISMDSEDLYISRGRVRVEYRFTNTTDAAIETLVAFPLPAIPPGTENDEKTYWNNPVSGLKFKTSVNGMPLALQSVEQAFFKANDISSRLTQLNIPLNRFVEGFDAAINWLPKAEREKLVSEGLIRDNGFSDHQLWAGLWELRTTLTRQQSFPAHQTVTVEHEYAPMAGGGVGGGLDPQLREQEGSARYFNEKRRKYCIDDHWLRGFDKKLKSGKKGERLSYSEVWLAYVLKTGANWKGPIRHFHLTVDKTKPDSSVSFCAAGVKRTSPTRFEVRLTDFTPATDLDILIVDWTPSHQ